jgi:acetoin utilization protein AcuB
VKVRQYMTEKLVNAKPEDTARQTYFRMREHDIRHMPVVDDAGKLVGVISDRDLRRPDWADEAIDVAHPYRLDDHMRVSDLMTRNITCVHVYDTLHKAVQIFLERRYGTLPVLNKDDDLVGVLSPLDVLKAFDEITGPPGKGG